MPLGTAAVRMGKIRESGRQEPSSLGNPSFCGDKNVSQRIVAFVCDFMKDVFRESGWLVRYPH